MASINQLIETSARQWGVPARVARCVFWAPLLGAALIAMMRLNVSVYKYLLIEDGPIEWAQFVFFTCGSFASAAVALRRTRQGYWRQGWLYFMLAASLLFVAGEEIAWGQRLLGLSTPEVLREINKQEEITLHNIGSATTIFKLAMLVGGGIGGAAYLANRRLRVERFANLANYLFVPPFFLSTAFLVVFCYYFFRFFFWPTSGFTITKYGEWVELCLAFGICAVTCLSYRYLMQRRAEHRRMKALSATANGQVEVDYLP